MSSQLLSTTRKWPIDTLATPLPHPFWSATRQSPSLQSPILSSILQSATSGWSKYSRLASISPNSSRSTTLQLRTLQFPTRQSSPRHSPILSHLQVTHTCGQGVVHEKCIEQRRGGGWEGGALGGGVGGEKRQENGMRHATAVKVAPPRENWGGAAGGGERQENGIRHAILVVVKVEPPRESRGGAADGDPTIRKGSNRLLNWETAPLAGRGKVTGSPTSIPLMVSTDGVSPGQVPSLSLTFVKRPPSTWNAFVKRPPSTWNALPLSILHLISLTVSTSQVWQSEPNSYSSSQPPGLHIYPKFQPLNQSHNNALLQIEPQHFLFWLLRVFSLLSFSFLKWALLDPR